MFEVIVLILFLAFLYAVLCFFAAILVLNLGIFKINNKQHWLNFFIIRQ